MRTLVAKKTAFALSKSHNSSNQKIWSVASVRQLRFRAESRVAKLTGPNTSTSNASFVATLLNGSVGEIPTFVRAATRDNAKETT